jgi:hypothetical protein
MTRLTAPIQRETSATVFEKGKHRAVIVMLLPNNTLGFRLKGSHRTFYLPVDGCYDRAVKAEVESNRRVKGKVR